MANHSLVMLAEVVRVGRIFARSGVPHVLWVQLSIWVLSDREVGIAREEEPEKS